jgi:hypothetical protein
MMKGVLCCESPTGWWALVVLVYVSSLLSVTPRPKKTEPFLGYVRLTDEQPLLRKPFDKTKKILTTPWNFAKTSADLASSVS